MSNEPVYVALVDEGVNVWRPAPAHQVDQNTYVLLLPEDYDADVETWEFPPGSVVRCERRRLSGGDVLAAVERILPSRRQSA